MTSENSRQDAAEKLLACPWCGTVAMLHTDFDGDFYVSCMADRCPGYREGGSWTSVSSKEAAEAWNRRTQPPQSEARELAGLLGRLDLAARITDGVKHYVGSPLEKEVLAATDKYETAILADSRKEREGG